MGGNCLDIGGTAKYFGVAEKTVRRWIQRAEELGLSCEKRHGKWYVDVDTVKHHEPAAESVVSAQKVADLERRLADEKKRSDAALYRSGQLEGQLQAQTQALLEWKEKENEAEAEIDRLKAEIAKRDSAGALKRLFKSW